MASIKGITLKNIKTFTGREGYGVEATIYMDNKRAGRYFDDAGGGEPCIDFQDAAAEKEIRKRADAFFAEYPHEFPHLDVFFCKLSDLAEKENNYKRQAKKGREILIAQNMFTDCDAINHKCFYAPKGVSEEEISKCKSQIEHACVYTSLADFDVV